MTDSQMPGPAEEVCEPPARPTLFHRMFDIGVWLKGLDGVLEIAGGVLLLFVSRVVIGRLVAFLTQHELAEDPGDLFSNALRRAASRLSPDTKLFGSLYLISHGLLKVLLAGALLRNKLWSYPAAIVFLCIFIGYQGYRLSYHYSLGLALLTVVDAIIVMLIWLEYRAAQRRDAGADRRLGP